jgi:hypothetical protein
LKLLIEAREEMGLTQHEVSKRNESLAELYDQTRERPAQQRRHGADGISADLLKAGQ